MSGIQKVLGLIPGPASHRCGGACNVSIWEIEAGGPEIQGQLWLHVEFEANLDLKDDLRSEEGTGLLGIGMTDSCELPCGFWDANLSLLSGQASTGLGLHGQLFASTAAPHFVYPLLSRLLLLFCSPPSQETRAGMETHASLSSLGLKNKFCQAR